MRGAASRCVPLPKHFAAGSGLRLFWENFMLQEGGARGSADNHDS